jgi:hypothetical protein
MTKVLDAIFLDCSKFVLPTPYIDDFVRLTDSDYGIVTFIKVIGN